MGKPPEIVSKRFHRWWKIRLFRGSPKHTLNFRRSVQFNELETAINMADIIALVPEDCPLSVVAMDRIAESTRIHPIEQ